MGRSRPANPASGSKAPAGQVCVPCQAEAAARATRHAQTAADPCSGKGFADPAFIGDFVGDFKQGIVANWASQTPAQRFAAVKALQEKQFTALGISMPSISQSADPALGFDNPVTTFGQANAGPWNMTFNGNLFTNPTLSQNDQTELAKTMMHEGRHIEQYYKTAQYRASQGASATDIASLDTPTHKPVGVPRDVIDSAAANPLPKKKADGTTDCESQAFGKTMDDAKWGKGALSQYTLPYADRPLEKDAFALEPTIDAKW